MRKIALLLLLGVLITGAACGDDDATTDETATPTQAVEATETQPPPEPTSTAPPPATDTPVPPAPTQPEEDAGASSLAERVAAKCVENAVEVQRMAERAVEFIEQDFGRRVSTDTVLQQLDQSTSGMTNVRCSEHLAVLIVLIGEG